MSRQLCQLFLLTRSPLYIQSLWTVLSEQIILILYSEHIHIWWFHIKCSSNSGMTIGLLWMGVYFALANGGHVIWLGLVAVDGGGVVFFQYLLWANKQEWNWMNPIITYKLSPGNTLQQATQLTLCGLWHFHRVGYW